MSVFRFKSFSVDDADCAMKVGTDSVLLGAWTDVSGVRKVIDIGSGSGLLALMLAQRIPCAQIIGVEADNQAAECAKKNFVNSPWHSRLSVVPCNIFDYEPSDAPDLLICNPPYFSNGLLSPDGRRAHARHATGALSPLSAIEYAGRVLTEYGSIALVTPADYADDIIYASEMIRMNVWRRCVVHTVNGKPPTRILWQISKNRALRQELSSIVIRNGTDFTDEYKCLTKDFYLAF